MGIEKKVVSLRLEEAFIERLKQLAKLENRNLSNYIETILKAHVDRIADRQA